MIFEIAKPDMIRDSCNIFMIFEALLVANISVEGGQLDQRTPETPH
jgi:hypothetical protein